MPKNNSINSSFEKITDGFKTGDNAGDASVSVINGDVEIEAGGGFELEIINNASIEGDNTGDQTLGDLGITATASELNTLGGITASTAELNYTDGVTSNIQTQLNNKYDPTNILGSVSESSGIPTGAIIETGSNDNGSYIKWANGTMICYRALNTSGVSPTARTEGSISNGAFYDRSWTFPVAFTAAPNVWCNKIFVEQSGSVRVFSNASYLTPSTSSATLRFWAVQTFNDVNAHEFAIGRWF